MKLLPLLLLVPLVASAQDVGLPFFAADPTSGDALGPCYGTNASLMVNSTINTGSAEGLSDGSYFCQKIQNISSQPVKIKRMLIATQINSGTPVFTGLVRSHYSLTNGTTYGTSATTNAAYTHVNGYPYLDLYFPDGTEPIIPAYTNYYVGYTKVGGSVTASVASTTGGAWYLDFGFCAFKDNATFGNDERYDMGGFELYGCFFNSLPLTDPCLTNTFASVPYLGSSADSWPDGAYGAQKFRNTNSTAVTIKRISCSVQVSSGAGDGWPSSWIGYIRTTGSLLTGTTYGSGSIITNHLVSPGGSVMADLYWPSGSEPVVPANTDFWAGAVLLKSNANTFTIVAGWTPGGTAYEDTSYYMMINNSLLTGDNRYDYQMSVVNCLDCTSSNLFVTIPVSSASSSLGTDGDYYSQKIKNNSVVPIVIKSFSWGAQTNDANGPPTWTGYVKDSASFTSGNFYGAASTPTNRAARVRDLSSVVDLNWTSGNPVIPALTDYYIGVKVAFNGGSVSERYQSAGSGQVYIDTSYIAYSNGTNYLGANTRDFDGIDIYACYPLMNCTSSNLWSSPISQSQLSTNSNFNLNGWTGQHIHNTSTSRVMIKKATFWLSSANNGGNDTVYALATSAHTTGNGLYYGGRSSSTTITNGAPQRKIDFVWDAGFEPIIPASTDFFIGVVPANGSQVKFWYQSSNVYETTSYSMFYNDFDDTTTDAAFEIYTCQ